MNLELLRELSEASGVPGQESAIRDIVTRELSPMAELSTDAMGSITARMGGSGPKVMIAAHMDEIGFVVRYVDDKGFLKIHPLGGFDPRMMCAQRVTVFTTEGPRVGTMMPGVKPKHMLSADEANKPLATTDFFIDCGLTGEEAKRIVPLGSMVAMRRECQEMGSLFTGKAMDDRVAVFVMIEALKNAKNVQAEIHAVATVQEEIGLRGAAAAGSGIAPDICIALDITLANDIPGIPDDMAVTKLGAGAAIKVLDGSLICHPGIVADFKRLAEEKGIAHQMELLPMGGTDAGGVQRLHGGIPSFTLSIPCRYVHTVNETVHKDDVQACIDLLAAYLESCHEAAYAKKP
jgi:putative aminopeptidase FrvX